MDAAAPPSRSPSPSTRRDPKPASTPSTTTQKRRPLPKKNPSAPHPPRSKSDAPELLLTPPATAFPLTAGRCRGVVVGLPSSTRTSIRPGHLHPVVHLEKLINMGRILLEDSKLIQPIAMSSLGAGAERKKDGGGAFGRKEAGSAKFGEWRVEGNLVKAFRVSCEALLASDSEATVHLKGPYSEEELEILEREAGKAKLCAARDAGKGVAFSRNVTKEFEWYRDYMKRHVRFRVTLMSNLCLGVVEGVFPEQEQLLVRAVTANTTHLVGLESLRFVPMGSLLTRFQDAVVKSFSKETFDAVSSDPLCARFVTWALIQPSESGFPAVEDEKRDLSKLLADYNGLGVEFSVVQLRGGQRLRVCFDETEDHAAFLGFLVYTCLPHWSPPEAPYVVYVDRRVGVFDVERSRTWIPLPTATIPSLLSSSIAFHFTVQDGNEESALDSEGEVGGLAYVPAVGDVVSFAPRLSLTTGVVRATEVRFEAADSRRLTGVVELLPDPAVPYSAGILKTGPKGRPTKFIRNEVLFQQPLALGDVCDFVLGPYDAETRSRVASRVRKQVAKPAVAKPTEETTESAGLGATPARPPIISRPPSSGPPSSGTTTETGAFVPLFNAVEPLSNDGAVEAFSAAAWRGTRVVPAKPEVAA